MPCFPCEFEGEVDRTEGEKEDRGHLKAQLPQSQCGHLV